MRRIRVEMHHGAVELDVPITMTIPEFKSRLPPDAFIGEGKLLLQSARSDQRSDEVSPSATIAQLNLSDGASLNWEPVSCQKHSVHLRWLSAGVRAQLSDVPFWEDGDSASTPLRSAALRFPPRRLVIGARGNFYAAVWADGASPCSPRPLYFFFSTVFLLLCPPI